MARKRASGGGVPPLEGPWRAGWDVLASPWLSWGLAVAAAAVILYALAVPGAGSPVSSVWLQVLLVALPFAVAARALDRGRGWVPDAVWALGLLVAGWGALQAGSHEGTLSLGASTEPTETYELQLPSGTATAHLGGALTAVQTEEGLALRLGIQRHEVGGGVLPDSPYAETDVGPWAVHVAERGLPAAPTAARLRLKKRSDGTVFEQIVPVGAGGALPDGTGYGVVRVSADFGRALGAAAQVTLTWGERQATAWVFTEAPTLDERLGIAPWSVEVLEVIAGPQTTLGVRRRGPVVPALAGLALMALGLLLGVREGRS